MNQPQTAKAASEDTMKKVVALCKRRGFVYQSSEIYGGLKSAYDYGPLGAELKRNLMAEWWRDMVHARENVVGIDASIIMHPNVWRASGHAAGFADPLVDCKISKERFRADKAPRPNPGDELPITAPDKGVAKTWAEIIEKQFGVALERDGNVLKGLKAIDATTFGFFPKGATEPTQTWKYRGYVCPGFGSPFLSEERQFNLMFRTALGSVDPMNEVSEAIGSLLQAAYDFNKITDTQSLTPEQKFVGFSNALANEVMKRFPKPSQNLQKALDFQGMFPEKLGPLVRNVIEEVTAPAMAYLRPETAQAMFVQFKNVMDSTGMRPPFGIAQMGKSFRNEITVEHFIFRSCEFEQMEMEFFCEPGTHKEWMAFWKEARMSWWQRYANRPENFKFRQHGADELAHYADDCYDIEYLYPWGWGELEGVASRTDYDLKKHEEHSGVKLRVTDPDKADPATGKKPWQYTPYVIEPAAGATRGLLVYLLDAYHEEERTTAKGEVEVRTVLKLHPRLSPIKCAVLPLISNKEEFPAKARQVQELLMAAGIAAKYDDKGSIGKRYAKHDEIGTPCCVTIDGQSLEDGTVTIRDRDTTEQKRVPMTEVPNLVRARLDAPLR